MAPLTSSARTARLEARRLRHEAEALRLRSRSNIARSRKRLEKAQVEAHRALTHRLKPQPSPWSELDWIRPDETLEQTLVPLP